MPKQISRLPPLGAIFLSAPPPNLKSWIRPCNGLSLLHEAVDFKGLVLGYGV